MIGLFLFVGLMDRGMLFFEKGKYEDAEKVFFSLLNKVEGAEKAKVLYYIGKLQKDPYEAILWYEKVVEEFPGSGYADSALYAIGKIYYALGVYGEAIKIFQKFLKKYSHSNLKSKVLYWYEMALKIESSYNKIIEKECKYVIQVGAFKNKENAERLIDILEGKGFKAMINKKIINGEIFYRVWLGEFSTETQAREVLSKLKKQGYDGNILRLK